MNVLLDAVLITLLGVVAYDAFEWFSGQDE